MTKSLSNKSLLVEDYNNVITGNIEDLNMQNIANSIIKYEIIEQIKNSAIGLFNSICTPRIAQEKINGVINSINKYENTAIDLANLGFVSHKDIVEIYSLSGIIDFPLDNSSKMVELAIKSKNSDNIALGMIRYINE